MGINITVMDFALAQKVCCTIFCHSDTRLSFWLTPPTTSTPVPYHKWRREAIKTQNISHWSAAQLIPWALCTDRSVCIMEVEPPRFNEEFLIRNVRHPLWCHSHVWWIWEKVTARSGHSVLFMWNYFQTAGTNSSGAGEEARLRQIKSPN